MADDVADDERNESRLFGDLQGDVVTNEQLERWNLLGDKGDDMVLGQNARDTEIDISLLLGEEEYNDNNEVEIASDLSTTPNKIYTTLHSVPSLGPATSSSAAAASSALSSLMYESATLVDSDATTKYLKGELDFAQFSEIMEKMKQEGTPSSPAKKSVIEDDSDDSPEVDNEEKDATWSPRRSKKKITTTKNRRHQYDIPKHLVGLMGEANLQYAHGNSDEALKMCLEIIRMAPMAAEPFRMLGMIYDEMGDDNTSLQYNLIAAHLQPDDPEEWVRLAQLSMEMGEPKQALACYTQASRYDNTNLLLVLEKCHLLESLGQNRKALDTYIQVLRCLPGDDASGYFILARNLCRTYHEAGNVTKAIQALTIAFDMHSQEVTSEDVNHLVELHMSQKSYLNAAIILMKHCEVVPYDVNGEKLAVGTEKEFYSNSKKICRCVVSELMPIDLRVKLVVCLLRLDVQTPVQELVQPLQEEDDWEDNGDLHFDLAEIYMDVGLYEQARPILHKLITCTQTYRKAAVWLRYGECLTSVGEVTESLAAYERVVDLAPNHVSARVALSALQQQLGKPDDAIKTLSKDQSDNDDVSESEVWLLMHKCQVLYGQGKLSEYVESSKQVVLSHLVDKQKDDVKNASASHSVGHKRRVIHDGDVQTTSAYKSFENMTGVSKLELYDLYKKASSILLKQHKYEELLDFALCSMTNPAFMGDATIINTMDDMAINACLLGKNSDFGYKYIRNLCVKHPDNTPIWNIFAQMLQYSSDSRHHRFCLRLMTKYPSNVHLNILNGHISTICGSYKLAIGEYCEAYKQQPRDPLICLCMGLMFSNMAIQKYTSQRHWIVTQSMAFLSKYVENRGDCQEVYYNMGRAMHQLGLLHVATFYYKKALTYGPAIPSQPEVFDMSPQIAYNLALLYRNNGAKERARILIQEYCTI